MVLQTSHAELMRTILSLIGSQDLCDARACSTLTQARQAYRRYLQSLRQRDIQPGATDIGFITEQHTADALRHCFANDSLLDDRRQGTVIAHQQDDAVAAKQARIGQALDELALYAPDYAAMLGTVITDIFILPSQMARGGSTSQAVGLIWMNPRLSYPTTDIVEMLVHEFTHHAMFLDELRYAHYDYHRILDPSTWVRSAILNTARPLDKVLHSIAVAVEVLLFRIRYLGHPATPRVHPPSDIMVAQLYTAIEETERRIHGNDIFQARATRLLANARQIFDLQLAPLHH